MALQTAFSRILSHEVFDYLYVADRLSANKFVLQVLDFLCSIGGCYLTWRVTALWYWFWSCNDIAPLKFWLSVSLFALYINFLNDVCNFYSIPLDIIFAQLVLSICPYYSDLSFCSLYGQAWRCDVWMLVILSGAFIKVVKMLLFLKKIMFRKSNIWLKGLMRVLCEYIERSI